MEFSKNKSIYMQIADYFYGNILLEKWRVDEKVPSVRQMAVDLEVNPNTVMRTYTMLQDKNIIYNQRGIGFFVSTEAKDIVKDLVKEQFTSIELPEMFKSMQMLGIDIKEIQEYYSNWKSNL
ncbi:GntR family transcriptional regulator [Candidatus Venteria ishoeyi]|uniref:HTH-type transcriptional repressor YtrA n=1 Tax=Candidatus Venteria ishoeyi TaxID=1899563 RepID=A0A1H6F837_9GAMM|nr:GntR family transcriptional regulator [Candidatus Venteria ishoeyi]SEH05226.1 HTH-type transcriptional repressor YtrA [Candidatus Venteria ishoeyi]